MPATSDHRACRKARAVRTGRTSTWQLFVLLHSELSLLSISLHRLGAWLNDAQRPWARGPTTRQVLSTPDPTQSLLLSEDVLTVPRICGISFDAPSHLRKTHQMKCNPFTKTYSEQTSSNGSCQRESLSRHLSGRLVRPNLLPRPPMHLLLACPALPPSPTLMRRITATRQNQNVIVRTAFQATNLARPDQLLATRRRMRPGQRKGNGRTCQLIASGSNTLCTIQWARVGTEITILFHHLKRNLQCGPQRSFRLHSPQYIHPPRLRMFWVAQKVLMEHRQSLLYILLLRPRLVLLRVGNVHERHLKRRRIISTFLT